jgi:hypothetical protein
MATIRRSAGRRRLRAILLLLGLSLGGLACDAAREVENTIDSHALAPKYTFGDSTAWALVTELQPVGEYLVVADGIASTHLTVLDRGTRKVVLRFGPTGRGPQEVEWVTFILPESARPPRFWTGDFGNRRAVLWEIHGWNAVRVLQNVNYGGSGYIRHPVFTQHGMLAGGLFPDASMLETDSTGGEIVASIGTPPYSGDDYPTPTAFVTVNHYRLAVDPQRTRVVLAHRYANRLDFYTLRGVRIGGTAGPRVVPRPEYTEVRNGMLEFDRTTMQSAYLGGVAATENFVYAAFCGCTHAEWTDGVKPHLIHVFTWDGRFVTELDVQEQITALAVLPGDSVMYTVSRDPYPMISEWELPRELRH